MILFLPSSCFFLLIPSFFFCASTSISLAIKHIIAKVTSSKVDPKSCRYASDSIRSIVAF